jgi:hypothetical protein
MPIYQTAHYQVQADAVDKVTAAIEEFVRYVRDNEPGTRFYVAWQQESDPPQTRQTGPADTSLGAPDRRRTTAPTASRAALSEHGRTRRDQPWRGRRRALSTDRRPVGTSAINGVAGAGQKRRPTPLSGPGRRRRGVPAGPAAQPAKLVVEPRLRAVVEAKLALRWSPQ